MLKGLAYHFQGPNRLQSALSLNEADSLGKYSIAYRPDTNKILAIKSRLISDLIKFLFLSVHEKNRRRVARK